jgi:AraC-like DNA-binding protein
MRLEDSTSATAHAVRRTILNGESTHVQLELLERFRVHLIGIFYAEVGPEWSSGGKQESDYLHHIDLTLTGHRQVVFRGEVLDMEPGVAFWFPGNTPLERKCFEPSKVLFFNLRCEWLPGVDPLLDWESRRPGPIGRFDSNYWRPWRHPEHKPIFNQLLQAQARILDWVAGAVPNLDEVILRHVQTHSQFNVVFDLIERKLAPNLRVEELALVYGTTLHASSMAFARNTGMSPKAYLKRRLNQQAMELLLNSDLKIREVASKLRFSDEFHFSRFFRVANGLAPFQYRKRFAKFV